MGGGAEGLGQVPPVADQRCACPVGQEQCLVRIERDAVGLVDALEQLAALVT